MAKLGVYYGLCPLIDQRSLLGVTEDSEPGHVIVTLDKNLAIQYRLGDQKQIHSWRTKDKFSSPVIYDKEQGRYVGVTGQYNVRIWQGDEENLDKLKKHKFAKSIHTLLTCGNKSFIAFKDGTVMLLNSALQDRKTLEDKDINPNVAFDMELLSVHVENEAYIGILICHNKNTKFMWNTFNDDGLLTTGEFDIRIGDNDASLIGQVLTLTNDQPNVQLLTLWSNGKLISFPLNPSNNTENPEQIHLAMIDSPSCAHPVTMASLNHHYIAMYGADRNQEGATLIIYNLQFKVCQSKQAFKLFTSGAKLWCISPNLLAAVGQNLAVVPFHLDTERLAALVGSHRNSFSEADPDVTIVEDLQVVDWGVQSNGVISSGVPDVIRPKVEELSLHGLPEALICEQLIPIFIEDDDLQSVKCCLQFFYDIPENCIAKLLLYILSSNKNLFTNQAPLNGESIPESLQPQERCQMLDKILSLPFSDVLLLPHVRTEVDLENTLRLLQYLCFLMSEMGTTLPGLDITQSEIKVVEWVCVLLDAGFQKMLLSRDAKIEETLRVCWSWVDVHKKGLQAMADVFPLLKKIKTGKSLKRKTNASSLMYSIEKLSLY